MKGYPTVSIITGTLNPSSSIFRRMLTSVAKQQYPKMSIEHIVVDGGSTNGTVELARHFGCRVFSYPKLRDREQVRFAKGFIHAKGELVLILESDNILPSSNWLERMVEPFIKHSAVFCMYPAYNAYEPDMSVLTKYCALFGSPDPTLYYLGKSDKIPLIQRQYDKGTIIKETSSYWVVMFRPENVPTLGDNGFMVRRNILARGLKLRKEYIHVDVFRDLVAMGYDTAGVVKNSVMHVMGEDILRHVTRRVEVKRLFTDERRAIRKYHVMDWSSPRDRWNLFKCVVFSLTFVQPLWVSVRGYIKIHEPAWFLHPVMCFLMVIAYTWSEVVFQLKRFFSRLRL